MARVEAFDPAYMKALFDYSYGKALRGYAWHDQPPIFDTASGP